MQESGARRQAPCGSVAGSVTLRDDSDALEEYEMMNGSRSKLTKKA